MDRTEIGNIIIAGMTDEGLLVERMADIVTRLDNAGWVIVPREPTQGMLDAVTASDQIEPWTDKIMGEVYKNMIDAALARS